MAPCVNHLEDDFHKMGCVCLYYRLYISLKLFIWHKASLLRFLLVLEIFSHWVEFSLSRAEGRRVAKAEKQSQMRQQTCQGR